MLKIISSEYTAITNLPQVKKDYVLANIGQFETFTFNREVFAENVGDIPMRGYTGKYILTVDIPK